MMLTVRKLRVGRLGVCASVRVDLGEAGEEVNVRDLDLVQQHGAVVSHRVSSLGANVPAESESATASSCVPQKCKSHDSASLKRQR